MSGRKLTPQPGINQNRGQKICLRLRYPGDKNQFLPLEQVVDTMLHELSHNVHGPHNAEFHALWDQLRKEQEALTAKGYTGEGFLSDGHRLGGRRVPRDEARRIARAAAEKRRTLYSGSGQRLGGAPVRVGTDIRQVIVDAIERRNTVLKGCGSDDKSAQEIEDLANQATRNGFRTKAEEDEANDRAIAQALWEMVQEDERKEYGDQYIPATPANPTGNGGGVVSPQKPVKAESSSSSSARPPTFSRGTRPDARHVSRLVTESAPKKPKTIPPRTAASSSASSSSTSTPPASSVPTPEPLSGWTCPICTLHNPVDFLACDACTSERPAEITQKLAGSQREASRPRAQTWRCPRCNTVMESSWWTCSTCGKMKENSQLDEAAVII